MAVVLQTVLIVSSSRLPANGYYNRHESLSRAAAPPRTLFSDKARSPEEQRAYAERQYQEAQRQYFNMPAAGPAVTSG